MLVKNKFEIYILKYFKCKNNYIFYDPLSVRRVTLLNIYCIKEVINSIMK